MSIDASPPESAASEDSLEPLPEQPTSISAMNIPARAVPVRTIAGDSADGDVVMTVGRDQVRFGSPVRFRNQFLRG